MKQLLAGLLLIGFALNNQVIAQQTGRAEAGAQAQQIPLLSDLFARYEEFNRLYAERRKAGANLSGVEPLRKRGEEAFRRGHIPGILEVLGEAQAVLTGRKWDDRQRFISSLTLEIDRLVIEPNQVLQVSLTRMFQVNIDKVFTSAPTVTLTVVAGAKQQARSLLRSRDRFTPSAISPTA